MRRRFRQTDGPAQGGRDNQHSMPCRFWQRDDSVQGGRDCPRIVWFVGISIRPELDLLSAPTHKAQNAGSPDYLEPDLPSARTSTARYHPPQTRLYVSLNPDALYACSAIRHEPDHLLTRTCKARSAGSPDRPE